MTADDLRPLSRLPGLTEKAQAAAPTGITLSNIRVTGTGSIPIYIEPGVTRVTLEGSRIDGTSKSTAIYLDAESGNHLIKNNKFGSVNQREVIAIDGSANNTIVGNYFSGLNTGGIFIYRNCGERAVSRQQMPQYNQILKNQFLYKKYNGPNPAIFIGSRQGGRYYCGDDSDSRYGSGVSDRDFAQHNTVVDNQIINRNPWDYIRDNDIDNQVEGNYRVEQSR